MKRRKKEEGRKEEELKRTAQSKMGWVGLGEEEEEEGKRGERDEMRWREDENRMMLR